MAVAAGPSATVCRLLALHRITLPKCNDAKVVPLSVNEVEAMIAGVPTGTEP